jgi:hypothetical protein
VQTLTEENEPVFKRELRLVKIDDFENDDKARCSTNFDKADLHRLNVEFGLQHSSGRAFDLFFNQECLRLEHAKISDAVTQGCVTRSKLGYNYMLHYLDQRYQDLIGPHGIEKWGDQLPQMAEKIRVKIAQDRWWHDTANQQCNQELCAVYFLLLDLLIVKIGRYCRL